jgi:phosphatidylinositol alpha-1,6-mannosyltransferase
MKHLLVTNDFPPKIGGIQSLLWEWWRRLPPDSFAVLTSPYEGSSDWDAEQPFHIERIKEKVLLPRPKMVRQINEMANRVGADFVVLDPAVPLGIVGPYLDLPYYVVLHGAEVTVPGSLPGSRAVLGRVLRNAEHVIAAGGYPAREAIRAARRDLPVTIVPPGVDTARFIPLTQEQKDDARNRWGIELDAEMILGLSRLVPRKGFDTVIKAVSELAVDHPKIKLVIAGKGRDRKRLERLASKLAAPVQFLGRVPDEDLPALYGSADVMSMMCRNRWLGLEQEGFGIVFLEAASCGVPQVAGESGGAAEAVVDGVTGRVMAEPKDASATARAINSLLNSPSDRAAMGIASRDRAVAEFSYDFLARRLGDALRVDWSTDE